MNNAPDGHDEKRMHVKMHYMNKRERQNEQNMIKLERNVKRIVMKFVQNIIYPVENQTLLP